MESSYRSILETTGPWSFSESVRFLEGFTPAAMTPAGEAVLRLAFVLDGCSRAAGVVVRPADGRDDRVEVFAVGEEPELAVEQVRRILSIDRDGAGVEAVAERDPVVGRLWRERRFLRPVLFLSPYEAAAWAIIGNRIRIRQAARIKAEMARDLGTAVTLPDGTEAFAFPAPPVLATLAGYPGLTERKIAWLRGIGEAAMRGELRTDRLRSMTFEDAMAHLCEIKGIGPFGAELILLRGAGEMDRIPRNESRFGRAVTLVYGRDDVPSSEEIAAIASAWTPYRTWVTLLLRTVLEERTGEISGSGSA
jgi:DNA-3-methyladenine glycosylase II